MVKKSLRKNKEFITIRVTHKNKKFLEDMIGFISDKYGIRQEVFTHIDVLDFLEKNFERIREVFKK